MRSATAVASRVGRLRIGAEPLVYRLTTLPPGLPVVMQPASKTSATLLVRLLAEALAIVPLLIQISRERRVVRGVRGRGGCWLQFAWYGVVQAMERRDRRTAIRAGG
jgi:hypothetical protein